MASFASCALPLPSALRLIFLFAFAAFPLVGEGEPDDRLVLEQLEMMDLYDAAELLQNMAARENRDFSELIRELLPSGSAPERDEILLAYFLDAALRDPRGVSQGGYPALRLVAASFEEYRSTLLRTVILNNLEGIEPHNPAGLLMREGERLLAAVTESGGRLPVDLYSEAFAYLRECARYGDPNLRRQLLEIYRNYRNGGAFGEALRNAVYGDPP